MSLNDTPETITIQLTQGQITIVSSIDADLTTFKWFATKNKNYAGGVKYTASRNVWDKSKKQYVKWRLHRMILERIIGRELVKGEIPDHINGDTLDNRRENLRLATYSQNGMNAGKHKNNQSGYKGVSYDGRVNKWRARIQVNGKEKWLGLFDNPEDAYKAYCEAAKLYHGEFSNFG